MAVTGLGVICALGNNTSETWNAVREGRSGIAPIHSVDISKLRFRNGAQVCGYDPSKHFETNHAHLLDPFCQFAIIAARVSIFLYRKNLREFAKVSSELFLYREKKHVRACGQCMVEQRGAANCGRPAASARIAFKVCNIVCGKT